VTASPATMTNTSVSFGGAWMVTGVTTSSSAIRARRPALTAKIRQKRGTVRASTSPTLAPAPVYGHRLTSLPEARRRDQDRYRSLSLELVSKPALEASA
jgi:hypothetical protein